MGISFGLAVLTAVLSVVCELGLCVVFPPNTFRVTDHDRKKHEHQKYDRHEFHQNRRTVIPPSFDSRIAWPKCRSIRSIRNQGHCGNCWAVSAASVVSDRICIASNQTKNVMLSATQLSGCADLSRTPEQNCLTGGDPGSAYYFVAGHGMCTGGPYKSREGCVPYSVGPEEAVGQTCSPQCTNEGYITPLDKDLHSVDSYWASYSWNHINRSEIAQKVALMQTDILHSGPITAGINIYRDFQLWNSSRGPYCTQPEDDPSLGGHAVRIIGWNTTTDGVLYWLIANSWGDAVGEQGVYWLEAGRNCLGVENFISAPIITVPETCELSSFCEKPVDQIARLDVSDMRSPVVIFQGKCALQVTIQANGTISPIKKPQPIARTFVGAVAAPLTRWASAKGITWFLNPAGDAAGGCRQVPPYGKIVCVSGAVQTNAAAQTVRAGTRYLHYSDSPKWIYTYAGDPPVERGIRLGALFTDYFQKIDSFFDLDGKRMLVTGVGAGNGTTGSVIGIMEYPAEGSDTYAWAIPPVPLDQYLDCAKNPQTLIV